MDVIEETKPRVEGEIVVMHDDVELFTSTSESQAEHNGPHMMVDEVGSSLVQEVKSSLCTPQRLDEVSPVVETTPTEASPQAILESGAPVFKEKGLIILDPEQETRSVEEFGVVKPSSNMRLEPEIHATGGESDDVQAESEETKYAECSRIERKFSCSEESSVDVHSEDSEKRDTTKDFLKMVSTIDHALLPQKNSEEFAGVAQEVETEPTLPAKRSHEVSVDVFIPDEWVEVEVHSVTEPEASTAGRAPSFASEKPSVPSDPVCVETVNSNLTTEHEAPSATGVMELDTQGKELICESLGIEKPITGTEREMASPNSIGTQSVFEKRKSTNLSEQPLPDSDEWKGIHSNENGMTSQDLQALPIQVGEDSKSAVPTSTQDEDIDLRVCPPLTSRETGELLVRELVPTQMERINVAENSPCTSESPVLTDVELTREIATDVDFNQGARHVKSTMRVPSFADWERVIEVDTGANDTMVEVLDSTSCAPPKQLEGIADIKEQAHRIWSLKNLKKRPVMVEPRTVTEQAIRPVKPKAPKVVGLSWPPAPLTAAQVKLYVRTDDVVTSPRQRVPESVGATDTIFAESKEELRESESSPSEQAEGMDGAKANITEQSPASLWSLEYLRTRPVIVTPRTVPHQTLAPAEPKAPKVVGLSWPPSLLTAADDKHYLVTSPSQGVAESVGATDTIIAESGEELLESESSPSEQAEGMDGAESNITEQSLARLRRLEYLRTRPVIVAPKTVAYQTLAPVVPIAPKVVGLSWPPSLLTAADDKYDVVTSPQQRVAESVGATDTIVAESGEELLESESSPSERAEGIDGAESNITEQSLARLWSLEYLRTGPVIVAPKTVPHQTLAPVEPKAPKVVGLSWPPSLLTAADDEHYVSTGDVVTSPRQRVAESVGATDTIVAESGEELLESESSPSERAEGIDGAESNITEQSLTRLWSLEYLRTRPVIVAPKTVPHQTLAPAEPKAPKVVGLSWPPSLLTAADDKHYLVTSPSQGVAESVGATDTIIAESGEELLESESSPSEQAEGMDGAESNITEQSLARLWSLEHLRTKPVIVAPKTVAHQTLAPVVPKAPKVVGLSWPPSPLTAADDKYDVVTSPQQRVAESVGATDTIVAESKGELLESESSPSERAEGMDGAEANITEQSLARLWRLEYLRTRPVIVAPRTVPHQTLAPVEPKAPKVVGLSWPPSLLTAADDEHYVSTGDVVTSPSQGVAESVGATDTIIAESGEELLESESSPSERAEGIDGAESNITEQSLARLWSLEHLRTKPVIVAPKTVAHQTLAPVVPKAPKVVGLSWPPSLLTAADDKYDVVTSPRQRVAESVGATDTTVAKFKEELLESESSPSERAEGMDGAEANINEQSLERLWRLEYLRTRPVMVEPRTVTHQTLAPVKLNAPKAVGLSWPPAPLATAEGMNVFT